MNQIIGGYEVKDEWFIGNGTFGAVYKAQKDGKFYAIKIFQTQYVKSEFGKARIPQEIKALQSLNNPNVVKIHDFGDFTSQGFEYYFIVMDYIEGKTFTEIVGLLDEDNLIKLMKSVFSTLNAIHTSGIIHRDLKPANIILKTDGNPIILDFGLAKLIDYTSITQTGDILGSYAYMSPEQVTDSKNIDKLSDYFAAGVIFYELATGKLPYDATNTPALIDQIKNQYPQPPSDLNPQISNKLENIILKLLEKQPYRRFQSLDEIINLLDEKVVEVNKKISFDVKFFIRLLHTEKQIVEDGVNKGLITDVIFPANFFKKYHPTVDVLKKTGVNFITDPATNRLTYTAFSKTLGVKELPYASGDDVTPIQKKDFHSINQIQNYVAKVIDYQVANANTQLSAPFFFSKNTKDEWFNINLKLLRESVAYRDSKYTNMPLWGGICMNVDDWFDEDVKNTILNRYVRWAPDGYFVYGDSIGRNSDLAKLYHYSDLLLKLQYAASVPVVACRVNGVGSALLSIGLAGVSSGISALDNFDETILSDVNDGYTVGTRYYIPELFSMITFEKNIPTKMVDIVKSSIGSKLKCECEYCQVIYESGVMPQRNIKMHFLTRKKQEIDEILSVAKSDRAAYIMGKLDTAIGYEKTLRSENIKIVNDPTYLRNWRSLVEKFNR